ncbi:MAG: hypothetical protein INR66_25730 [Gordonia polyisoprenivorans]|nr:hypothetical protein [Gordonia polyisoprenivorans]
MLITGAGASASFVVNNTRLGMMGEWSNALIGAIGRLNPSYLAATRLRRGWEVKNSRRGSETLRAIVTFDQITTIPAMSSN